MHHINNKQLPMLMTFAALGVASISSAVEINPVYTLSGAVEVRANYADAETFGDDSSASDLTIEEARAVLDIAVTDDLGVTFASLYKEGEVDMDVHEAYISFKNLAVINA